MDTSSYVEVWTVAMRTDRIHTRVRWAFLICATVATLPPRI